MKNKSLIFIMTSLILVIISACSDDLSIQERMANSIYGAWRCDIPSSFTNSSAIDHYIFNDDNTYNICEYSEEEYTITEGNFETNGNNLILNRTGLSESSSYWTYPEDGDGVNYTLNYYYYADDDIFDNTHVYI